MAESLAEAAEEAAEGIGKIAVDVGGKILLTISGISAKSVGDVCTTAVKLGAIYAGYKLIAKAIDGAVSRGLGGERDDQEIRDIKPGSLHVLLHCFTDQRLLDVLDDFESGRMKDRLEKEFSEIGIEVEGLKVGIDNIEEVKKRKEQILSSKKTVAENVADVNVVQKETNEEAKTKERMKESLKKDFLEIGVDDIQELKKHKEQILSSNIQMAENVHVHVVHKETCEEARTNEKIFVCGGCDGKITLKSVESYSWHDNSWRLEPAMNENRSVPSAFVYDREIYVSGGSTGTKLTDSIESLNVDEGNLEWKQQFKMPIKCNGHKMVCHENNVIQTGGRDGDNVSDGFYEISLNPPHNTKLLTRMPQPIFFHGCEIIDNQVVVAGGQTSKYAKDTQNAVYVYDLANNVLKILPPLPFPITQMATVSYRGNVILIGGVNEKSQTLNTVVMYDAKTGKIKMLPCLNHKRAACAAVINSNVIVVMGGFVYETKAHLNSVECLDLNTNVWRELSPMTTKRSGLAAILRPIS